MRKRAVLVLPLCVLGACSLSAQAPFPAGLDGELYFCPRIDLVPAADGGPYTVALDGILDDPVWQRAAFHTVNTFLATGVPAELDPPTLDFDMIYAAVADANYLYVAWKVVDDTLITGETSYCDVWKDDSIELYIDANNDGPNCTASADSCYKPDDAQYTYGADQIGKEDPEALEIGGVAGKGSCDFSGQPWPELTKGIIKELQHGDLGGTFGDGLSGWQGEVAVALSTMGNGDDGTPAWEIDPSHGTCIGWSVQGNDDDSADVNSLDRDHKTTWAKREADESAWRNPGVFGKLAFIDPTKPVSIGACALPVELLQCKRNTDGTVAVTWKNPGTANPAIDTQIFVDDILKATVTGDKTSATLSEADVPRDGVDHVISVKNNSDETPPTCVIIQSPFADCGGIRFWNILGSFDQAGGASPGDDAIRLDYMTDGVTSELDFEWKPGAQIRTDFGNAAASTRIRNGIGVPAHNPGGVPTVYQWQDPDSRINFQDVYRLNYDNAMNYAQCYVINKTGSAMEVYLRLTSDDSVQVYLNGEEVWIHNIPRPAGNICDPADPYSDVSPDGVVFTSPHVLEAGQNNLIMKVFDGTGASELGLRFQDETGEPITEGLDISLVSTQGPKENCTNGKDDDADGKADCEDSDCAAEPSCLAATFHRGDSDDNGDLQLTDAIRILGFLFLGGAAPACMDAADADDNGQLQLTDAIRILGFLFLGGAPPMPPGPPGPGSACGADPTPGDGGVDLGCAAYTHC